MSIVDLLPPLTRFLEAATAAAKWRVVRPMEARLQKDMRYAFTAQGAAFLQGLAAQRGKFNEASLPPNARHAGLHLGEALSPQDWLSIFDTAARATYTLFLDPLEATAAAGLTAGASNVIADLGMDIAFNLRNPRAVQYLQQHGAQNVAGINSTTRSYLQTVITQGVDEGWSYARTAKAIKDRYAEFAVGVPQQHIRSRAELVAVSESGMAYETGSNFIGRDLQDAGLRMVKSWLSAGDKRVDPHCLANEAQGWIAFDEAFLSGDMHPLAHPACRCTHLLRRAPS